MLKAFWTGGELRVLSASRSPTLALVEMDGRKTLRSVPPFGSFGVPAERRPASVLLKSIPATGTGRVSPIYVNRVLLNGADVQAWFRAQGFGQMVDLTDMHVTLAFSKIAVAWDLIVRPTFPLETGPSRERRVMPLGKEGAVVLKFVSLDLDERWRELRACGCSWDFEGFQPHVTLTYSADEALLDRLPFLAPYYGPLLFGEERYAPLDIGWRDKVQES